MAIGDLASHDFFSARIGCQTDGFYGLDLAALCIKHAARRAPSQRLGIKERTAKGRD